MGEYNIFISIFGLMYLVYAIIFRNKVTLYNRRNDMVVLNKERYFKLQLYFSIVNSLWMIIVGIIIARENLITPNIFLIPIPFHIINLISTLVARALGYIDYD
ncbi:hypothetical protein J2Z44_002469 [Clostridium punense]|uniref:DUF3784 domain-containing protein n=1 Tax=Clostridium punense TaxID=1054297 RepID=A0ABS4K4D4_9CLOT|nr:hypothetical protein [Clostridium punense]EQB86285.1 hypothetical protein M918_15210 [Clostridium sp. BL8]MBP2022646.1 hypothetical protein [Clostridium punense]